MRVDFYQLSRDPVDRVVALLARKVMDAGQRLVVAATEPDQRGEISAALWAQDGAAFLVHGQAGGPDDARQPILIGEGCTAINGAKMAILADGQWRAEAEGSGFDRVMLLFDAQARDAAAGLWRQFAAREDIDNRIFKQRPDGGWREGA